MNYYLRLQRHSEGYAARVFEELYPSQAHRRAVAKFLADAITQAAAVSPAWSITLQRHGILVNVGPARLFELLRGGYVSFGAPEHGRIKKPSWLHDMSEGRVAYKSVGAASRWYSVQAAHIAQLPKVVRSAALRYVEIAAGKRRAPPWIASHSPGVIRFLESYLQLSLPQQVTPSDQYIGDHLDEASASDFNEGALTRCTRNVFERNRTARSACLAHYGSQCFACGVILADQYGEMANDVIHVHHLVPLSEIRQKYKINPIRDLRPLCPNCHAVVHLQSPPLSPEHLRKLLHSR